jgi:hypothetical protein
MKKLLRMPTFQQIRQQAKTREGQPVTRQDIVSLTGLTLGEVYVVDIGGYSSKQNIQTVLFAFNLLTGCRLTMNDIRYRGAIA